MNDGLLRGLAVEELITLEKVAWECAQLFQRSSSCVEGGNGQLALHHHQLHRISSRKLNALQNFSCFQVTPPTGPIDLYL